MSKSITNKNTFEDSQRIIRYRFVKRIIWMFTIVLIGLTSFSYFTSKEVFYYYFGILLAHLIGLIFLYKTKKYKPISTVLFISIYISCGISIFTIDNLLHFQESLWMLTVILFSFFVLGKRWSYVFIAAELTIYFIYYLFVFPHHDFTQHIQSEMYLTWVTEFIIAMVSIIYLVIEYENYNAQATKFRLNALKEIEEEKVKIEVQAEEKKILLQETHHRVKNNLQVIISLLRMQAGEISSPETKENFQRSISRLLTLSLIHQNMYENDSMTNTDVLNYIKILCDSLMRIEKASSIDLSVSSEVKELQIDYLVPLGLIVNELLINSIHHGFSDSIEHPVVEIEITTIDKTAFQMRYFDNGKWKENYSKNAFGLLLIEVFVEELRGRFFREVTQEGTSYCFSFFTEA